MKEVMLHFLIIEVRQKETIPFMLHEGLRWLRLSHLSFDRQQASR